MQVEGYAFTRFIWFLQRVMWAVTLDKTLKGCHRWRAPNAERVQLIRFPDGRVSFLSLQNSHSVWSSPIAAVAIARQRAKEVRTAVQNHLDGGPGNCVEFLTLTLSHDRSQSLETVWDQVQDSWDAVINTAQWRGSKTVQGDKATYGIEHFFKSVEVTHGANGWHVHLHVLLFLDRPLSQDARETLENRVYERWANRAVSRGFKAPSRQHGALLEQTSKKSDLETLANYVTKGHMKLETLHHEVTGGAGKRGRSSNRTPFQLLESIGTAMENGEDYARDVRLWRVWEKGSKGRRQCSWSRGAKEALGVFEVADSEVQTFDILEEAKSQEEQDLEHANPFAIALIPPAAWKLLQDNVPLRLQIVEYCTDARDLEHAVRRAHRILAQYGVVHESVKIELEPPGETLDAAAAPLTPDQFPTAQSRL